MAQSLCTPDSTDIEMEHELEVVIHLIASNPLLILSLFVVSIVVDIPWVILGYTTLFKNFYRSGCCCLLLLVTIISLLLCPIHIILMALTIYFHKFVVLFSLALGRLLGTSIFINKMKKYDLIEIGSDQKRMEAVVVWLFWHFNYELFYS